MALRLCVCIVRGVRASALTTVKPRGYPGLWGKDIKMITVIEILISLPEAILALILIREKVQKLKDS